MAVTYYRNRDTGAVHAVLDSKKAYAEFTLGPTGWVSLDLITAPTNPDLDELPKAPPEVDVKPSAADMCY